MVNCNHFSRELHSHNLHIHIVGHERVWETTCADSRPLCVSNARSEQFVVTASWIAQHFATSQLPCRIRGELWHRCQANFSPWWWYNKSNCDSSCRCDVWDTATPAKIRQNSIIFHGTRNVRRRKMWVCMRVTDKIAAEKYLYSAIMKVSHDINVIITQTAMWSITSCMTRKHQPNKVVGKAKRERKKSKLY